MENNCFLGTVLRSLGFRVVWGWGEGCRSRCGSKVVYFLVPKMKEHGKLGMDQMYNYSGVQVSYGEYCHNGGWPEVHSRCRLWE